MTAPGSLLNAGVLAPGGEDTDQLPEGSSSLASVYMETLRAVA